VLFFAVFLAFYYVVMIQKASQHVSTAEVFLYIWLAAFSYNGTYAVFNGACDQG